MSTPVWVNIGFLAQEIAWRHQTITWTNSTEIGERQRDVRIAFLFFVLISERHKKTMTMHRIGIID